MKEKWIALLRGMNYWAAATIVLQAATIGLLVILLLAPPAEAEMIETPIPDLGMMDVSADMARQARDEAQNATRAGEEAAAAARSAGSQAEAVAAAVRSLSLYGIRCT